MPLLATKNGDRGRSQCFSPSNVLPLREERPSYPVGWSDCNAERNLPNTPWYAITAQCSKGENGRRCEGGKDPLDQPNAICEVNHVWRWLGDGIFTSDGERAKMVRTARQVHQRSTAAHPSNSSASHTCVSLFWYVSPCHHTAAELIVTHWHSSKSNQRLRILPEVLRQARLNPEERRQLFQPQRPDRRGPRRLRPFHHRHRRCLPLRHGQPQNPGRTSPQSGRS